MKEKRKRKKEEKKQGEPEHTGGNADGTPTSMKSHPKVQKIQNSKRRKMGCCLKKSTSQMKDPRDKFKIILR